MSDVTAAMVESVFADSAGVEGGEAASGGESPTATEGAAGETASGLEDADATGEGDEPAAIGLTGREPNIPLSRHKAILANARKKADAELRQTLRGDFEKEFRAQYGLGDGVDAYQVRQMLEARAWMEQDPQGYAQFVATSVLGPGWQQQAQPSQATAKAEAKRIEAQLKAESGEAVYTADQIQELLSQAREDWRQEVQGLIRPALEDHAARQLQQQSQHQAVQILERMRKDEPHFKELEPKIKAFWKANPGLSLAQAYARTLATELPSLLGAQKDAAATAAGVARKAVASAAAAGRSNPSAGQVPATERKILDVVRETARELGHRS